MTEPLIDEGLRASAPAASRSGALRSYLWSLVAVGLLALGLTSGFALLASERLAREEQASRADRDARISRAVARHLERAIELALARAGPAIDLGRPEGWTLVRTEVEDELPALPEISGLRVVGPGFVVPIRSAEGPPSLAGELLAAPGVRFEAWLRPGPSDAAWGELRGFLALGIVLIGVAVYLAAATILLLGRAQLGVEASARHRALRLRMIRDLAAAFAHEVRNPLNAIGLHLQYLERSAEATGTRPAPEDYLRLHRELGRIRRVVDRFVDFARLREPLFEAADLGPLIEDLAAARKGGVPAIVEKNGSLRLQGDPEILRRALGSAIEALEPAMGAWGAGSLRIVASGQRREVWVDLECDGRPESPAGGERPSRAGLPPGLEPGAASLALARLHAESHAGSCELELPRAGALRLRLRFPRRPPLPATASPPA
jgi:signal transduction histidine kinase